MIRYCILATRPSELQSRAGHNRDTGAARPSEQQRRTVPDLFQFQVILSSDYGIAYESLKVYECLKTLSGLTLHHLRSSI